MAVCIVIGGVLAAAIFGYAGIPIASKTGRSPSI
jgi:hypothetical protein